MLAYFTTRAQEEYTSTRPRGTGFQWRCRPTFPIRLSSMRSASSPMVQSWIARAVLQTLRPFVSSTRRRRLDFIKMTVAGLGLLHLYLSSDLVQSCQRSSFASIWTRRRRVQTATPWVGCCAAQRSAPVCFSAECPFHNCAAVMLMTVCRALLFAAVLANTEVGPIQQDAKFFSSPGTNHRCAAQFRRETVPGAKNRAGRRRLRSPFWGARRSGCTKRTP